MPTFTVQQLLTPMTPANVRANGVTLLQSLGLQPQNWPPGGTASSMLTYASNIISQLSGNLSNSIAAQWVATATGSALQLLSYYFYGVTPPQATFASGSLTLVNTGGGIFPPSGSYAPGQASFASTVANAAGVFPTYTNSSTFSLGALQTLTVPIVCVFAGSGGNAPPGAITIPVTSMLGVTVSNAAAVLGTDPLTDAELRQLDLNSIAARSVFGPQGAYAVAIQNALNTVSSTPVNINRWTFLPPNHTGTISIIVSSPSGTTDPNDVSGVVTSINNSALALGATLSVTAAIPVNYLTSITCWVSVPIGTSAAVLQTAMATALAAFIGSTQNPIGGATAYDPILGQTVTGLQGQTVASILAGAIAATVPGAYMISQQGCTTLILASSQVAVDEATINLPIITFQSS